MYHILFIHSSIDGHLSFFLFFWLLWIMLLWTFMYRVLGIYLGVKLLDHMLTLCLTFRGTAKLFSTAAITFYNPTSTVWGFQFRHIFASMYSVWMVFYCPIIYFDLFFLNPFLFIIILNLLLSLLASHNPSLNSWAFMIHQFLWVLLYFGMASF